MPSQTHFDILHYALHLDFSQLPSRHLNGRAESMKITPKTTHGGVINLDLLDYKQILFFRMDSL
ncbi:MAG: hypothetical protein U5L96_05300 [Owenweeksia sp.]|nr:hypothetical protein [Owenweeksia sp.]